MNKVIFIAIVFLTLMPVSAWAESIDIEGITYHEARELLIERHWQPLRTHPEDSAGDNLDIQSGNGPVFWSMGYTELDSCSGTGEAFCVFLFEDKNNKLRVITKGEEHHDQNNHALVTSWELLEGVAQK